MAKTGPILVAFVSEHHILAALDRVERRLTAIERAVGHVAEEQTIHDLTEEHLMSDLNSAVADLETRVSEMSDVEESAGALLGELGSKVADLTTELQNAGVDPALVQRLADLGTAISDEDGKLAAAVAANTPAAPEPTAEPAPTPDTGDVDADGNPI